MLKITIMIVPIIWDVVSSGFYAVDCNKIKPKILGIPQIKIIPEIVTNLLIRSTRKNKGKLSNMRDNADLALSK